MYANLQPAPRLRRKSGFTLIELSIVLVIIGLLAGGVLVGRDLIKAAEVHAQVAQIEQFKTASNTFRVKYGYLAGDIPDPAATQFGFKARGTHAWGEGDGNGILQGSCAPFGNAVCTASKFSTGTYDTVDFVGETVLFWADLSQVALIPGKYVGNADTIAPAGSKIYPDTKLGNGGYVGVGTGGVPYTGSCSTFSACDGRNYFSTGSIGVSVSQAYAIDKKIDDGLPQTGTVLAVYAVTFVNMFIGDTDPTTRGRVVAGDGVAMVGDATTCYDNGNVAGATEKYSMGVSGGSNMACALTFRF